MKRECGVLLPIFSLPSPYGIGTLGKAAEEWLDFLFQARQSLWQVLPIGPTGYGDSPYQSFSSFAGNPYFIDPDLLCGEKLLKKSECEEIRWYIQSSRVDYGILYRERLQLMHKAFERFESGDALDEFRTAQRSWLEDYCLFSVLKEQYGGDPWQKWPADLQQRDPNALRLVKERQNDALEFQAFLQFEFFKQWNHLKSKAYRKGIRLIGDLPIYAALDSADTWANQQLFLLDRSGQPTEVAGCPPDAFSPDGQLWGNPLYRWWLDRLRAAFSFFDVVRIDHFRGLESYYAIPHGESTARNGKWRKGPGEDFIHAVKNAFPSADIIAEDLGFLTPKVRSLQKASGFPGMKILQFAFDARETSDYLPYRYPKHCVAYTGTHDNDTMAGWLQSAARADVRYAKDYLRCKNRNAAFCTRAFVCAVLESEAERAVIPIQDWLTLGSTARINTPGTQENNWAWRLKAIPDQTLAHEMAHLSSLYGRAE